MRAVSLPRIIEWRKLLQFVISTYSFNAKRAFSVVSINRQLTLYNNVQYGRTRLNTSSNNGCKSLYSSEASNNWNDVPVVKAFLHRRENSSNPTAAVYWCEDSKFNRFKEHSERSSITMAEIEVVCLALKQAVFQMNLPRVRLITNSKFVWKHFGKMSLWWNWDEFLQQKSVAVFNSCLAEAEDLYRLLHMIDAKIEYNSVIEETTTKFFENLISKKESEQKPGIVLEKQPTARTFSSIATAAKLQSKNAGIFAPEMLSATDSGNHAPKNLLVDNIPIVYTCGVLHIEGNDKKYVKAGCGVYWPHAPELSTGRRYNFYPITLVRCQLQAIIDAVQQAVDQNYRSIVLRTDCISFLVHHSRQWLKANGSYVRYHDQYLRIMDLCSVIKVRFQRADNQVALGKAEALAENGVCLPIPARRSRKKMYDTKTSLAADAKCSL